MKAKIDKVSKFSYPEIILEEKNHEMDMPRAYIWASRTSNAQFSYAIFGFDVCGYSIQITSYYLKLYFGVGVFL